MCQPPLFDEVFAGGATPGLVRPSQPSSLGRVYGRLLVGVLNVVGLGGKTSPAGASVATALFPMPANAKMGSRARATGSPESDDLRSPRGVGRGNAAHGRSATVAEGVMRSPWRPSPSVRLATGRPRSLSAVVRMSPVPGGAGRFRRRSPGWLGAPLGAQARGTSPLRTPAAGEEGMLCSHSNPWPRSAPTLAPSTSSRSPPRCSADIRQYARRHTANPSGPPTRGYSPAFNCVDEWW